MNLSRIFSNTDYLGALEHDDFSVFVTEGMKKYGVHFAGSRLSNTCPDIYEQVEQYFIDKYVAEAAILGSSGSFMGPMILDFCKNKDVVLCQSGIHPALQFKLSGMFRFDDLSQVKSLLHRTNYTEIAILANANDPITLRTFDWDSIKLLPRNITIHLIIDDSHGIGITGSNGIGAFAMKEKLPGNIRFSVLASLGKAFSVPGGIIFGDKELVDHVRHSSEWGGSSPVPPAYAHAFLKMQDHYRSGLAKLRQNIRCFEENIDRKLIHSLPEFPVFVLKPPKMSEFLDQFGFTISSFGYPNAGNPKVERIVINSAKKKIDILQLAEAVNLKTSIVSDF
ncbi:MAG TPA: hypothetical protein DCX89_09005 [Saprospirales bacterium]|nr:hypothetical protein [Saprospirales bacterium]HAY72016.1 hypothetical protein [Saprospirales bacterium]HRQ29190.1 aminotransferase class I/II-fold pyridoxal phosphate-dependent enzyme [Saprospiraceae bacterium]